MNRQVINLDLKV